MSIAVELQQLQAVIERYRFAYLLTRNPDGAPHAVAVSPVLEAGRLRVSGLGRRSRAFAQASPAVGLLWPPQAEGGHSLIVDGQAVLDGEVLRVTPTRAVLHRPAPPERPPVPGACGADCVELGLPPGDGLRTPSSGAG